MVIESLGIDSSKRKKGRWGRGQENQMKLFSGRVSAGLQFSSALVIDSVGGRAADSARCSNISSQAGAKPSDRVGTGLDPTAPSNTKWD